MPMYDYTCPNCEYKTEVIQWSLTEVITCPNCGGEMTRKFPSNQLIYMKGEGGYPSRRRQIFNTTMRKHPKLT